MWTVRRCILCALLALGFPAAASAQKTDVVTLLNGDRLTGEVKGLDRGRLEFSTDDAGTLYLEWDKLVSVVSKRRLEVVTTDGRRFLGSLAAAAANSVAVLGEAESVTLPMSDVTIIRPIGRSFWSKIDGSIDAGFSYTRSSGVAQMNVNSDLIYRKFASQFRLTTSLNLTRTDDEEGRDDRGTVEGSYLRYPWREWFIVTAARFENNESLGLELRSQIALATGPRLINSNRAQLELGGGLVLNDERGVDVEPAQNVEALLVLQASYFTYDRPKTNLDFSIHYYPSLSNRGRHRVQLDAGVKREFFRDLFIALTVYNTYDNRPPNPTADTNDVGVVASIGWTF